MILNDVTLNWTCINQPNTKYTPRWETQAIVSAAQKKVLEGHGLKVKVEEDGTFSMRFKRNCETYAGKANKQPIVLDENKVPITDEIGNGSIGNVQYRVYEYKQYGGGISSDLQAIQVTDLKTYAGKDGDEFSSTSAESTEFGGSEVGDDLPF